MVADGKMSEEDDANGLSEASGGVSARVSGGIRASWRGGLGYMECR